MHKKSLEAAHKLNEDDDDKSTDGQDPQREKTTSPAPPIDKEELRSESIAQLRAKAQSYSAKMREAISLNSSEAEVSTKPSSQEQAAFSSSFDTPNKSDSCDSEPLDPANWQDWSQSVTCRGIRTFFSFLSFDMFKPHCHHNNDDDDNDGNIDDKRILMICFNKNKGFLLLLL